MIYLMHSGHATEREVERIRMLPDFRKATRNMAMAYASLERIVAELPPEVMLETGLVFGSSHGELETTKEFLKTLAEQKVARPILFQNSLHNSTVGFLAMKLGMTAPTVTLSNGIYTAEDVFEAARLLLIEDVFDTCLVTVVDGVVPDLRTVMEMNHRPEKGVESTRLGEGATTLLLTTQPSRFSFPWVAAFPESFRIVPSSMGEKPRLKPFSTIDASSQLPEYDTNALEGLLKAIRHSGESGVSFLKRNGGFSEIAWERPT